MIKLSLMQRDALKAIGSGCGLLATILITLTALGLRDPGTENVDWSGMSLALCVATGTVLTFGD